ncbi:ATP-binding protein [Kribbella koreensis]|uniref:ATP-binding protein n=1 Tax=Kribbella koreensis TaxID=57909 RepID=UPI003CD08F63
MFVAPGTRGTGGVEVDVVGGGSVVGRTPHSGPTQYRPPKPCAAREEKASVAIASSESFGGWTKTFTDPRLCAAIVDRLTFGGTILETGTDSYRLAQATRQRTT